MKIQPDGIILRTWVSFASTALLVTFWLILNFNCLELRYLVLRGKRTLHVLHARGDRVDTTHFPKKRKLQYIPDL